MKKSTTIIITATLTVLFLIGIMIVYYVNRGDKLAKNLDEAGLISSQDLTPPPDTMPPYIIIGGELITLYGDYNQISPGIQDKIATATFLGVTVNAVLQNQIPDEELQANFVGEGCSVYYYKGSSEETYIIVDGENPEYCFYAEISN
ncbi:MAG: hypothetical protein K0R00_1468 [Herbinix sp.]|jgi:hypothetical protein|nr:hypothetical protein [Herbinix sp.]